MKDIWQQFQSLNERRREIKGIRSRIKYFIEYILLWIIGYDDKYYTD